jgi:selenide, water dikinase
VAHADLLVGTSTADDAGVFRIAPDLALVQTVDFFTPIVDDAWEFGAIAAANAFSDVYAMGGEPRTALNIACFPQTGVPFEILTDILRGGIAKAGEAGVVVVGGHTVIDEEIKFGMAVTGVVHPDRILRNVGARPGDALLLTKALGTGIVTTARKRDAGAASDYATAVASMMALNAPAARVLAGFEVHACTDVTGFGLLGHGYEMAHGSDVRVVFEAGTLPLLPSARALAAAGHLTGGCRRNRDWLADRVEIAEAVPPDLAEIAWDPQTSGGLLVAVPAADSVRLLEALRSAGVDAAAVGRVEGRDGGPWVALRR